MDSKNDNLKKSYQTSQLNAVKDTNEGSNRDSNEKLNKMPNKEVHIEMKKIFNKELTNKEQNKEDEIPLIDDGIEETTTEKNENHHLQTSSINNQTRSNCEMQKLNDFNNDQKSLNTMIDQNQIDHNSSSDQNLKQNYQNLASNTHFDQMINNFQNIRLNEDESINSESSENANIQITDLCQLDSVELNPDEQEEKERLIQQLLELRNTLDDLSNRVNSVRDMSYKLTNENNVLNQYVENLIFASSVFQSLDTNPTGIKRRQRK